MTTLIAENNFQTVTTNTVNAGATGEIQIELVKAPISNIGVLTLGTETATPEDIFFHRKSGLSVYTYAINRKTPYTHAIGTSVQMNDSAELFNFLSANIYTTFYTYKISLDEVFVMGGKIYKDDAIITIPSVTLTIVEGYNYIYLTTLNTIAVKNDPSGFVVGLVTKTGATITIEKYNVVGFGAKGEQGETGAIASVPPNTTQTVVDNVVPPVGSTFTYMDAELWTKITYPDGSYLLNLATGNTHSFGLPAGKYLYSSTNEQWSSDPIAGTYNAGTHTITWSNGSTTTGTTGVTTVPDGNIAYQNEANVFQKAITFEGDTTFLGRTSFPYYDIGSSAGSVTFDQKLGMQQKVTFTGASAHTVTFNNLIQSCGVFAVVQSGTGSLTFAMGTGNGSVVDKYVIAGSFTVPMSLAVGTHFFSLNVFSTAIHIMYVGSSVSF